MLKYLEPLDWLPTAEELLMSENTPLNGEIQGSIPNLLKSILATIFTDRTDYFFGINLDISYDPDVVNVTPDGFLSLGVNTVKADDENLRSRYILWEEEGIVPHLVVEVVSQNYRGEYTSKKDLYENLGILYYVVYNPLRKRKSSLDIYRLINGKYLPVIGSPVWMAEIGLGIGKERAKHQGVIREWLFWYDKHGQRYLTSEEIVTRTKLQLQSEQSRSQRLSDRLCELGINPDDI